MKLYHTSFSRFLLDFNKWVHLFKLNAVLERKNYIHFRITFHFLQSFTDLGSKIIGLQPGDNNSSSIRSHKFKSSALKPYETFAKSL